MLGRFLMDDQRKHLKNSGDTASWWSESVRDSVGLEAKLSSLRIWLREIRLKNSR